MKKILLGLSLILSSLAALAQTSNIEVTSFGKTLSNGEVVYLGYEVQDWGAFISYEWESGLYVRSKSGNVDLTMSLLSEQGNVFAICWPDFCITAGANVPLVKHGTIGTDQVFLDTHALFDCIGGKQPTFPMTAQITFTEGNGASTVITLNCLNEDAAGVEDIAVDGVEVSRIFDLQGRELSELQPGINIVVFSNGTVKKIAR